MRQTRRVDQDFWVVRGGRQTATGFSRISLNFRVITQAASKTFAAGLNVYCLRSRSLGDAESVLPCSVRESARKSSASLGEELLTLKTPPANPASSRNSRIS